MPMSEPYIPLLRIPGQQAKLATLNRHTEGRRFRGLQSYPSRGYSPTLPGAVPCFAVRSPGDLLYIYIRAIGI